MATRDQGEGFDSEAQVGNINLLVDGTGVGDYRGRLDCREGSPTDGSSGQERGDAHFC